MSKFYEDWITFLTLSDCISIAERTIPQGLKEITARLDKNHIPVNYDSNFFPDSLANSAGQENFVEVDSKQW
jgi:hypothetical protein